MNIGALFLLFATVFIGLSLYDVYKKGKKMTASRKTWIVIAVIFTIVGLFNLILTR